MKRIAANIEYIVRISIQYTGIIFAVLGFVGMFAPLDDVFNNQLKLWQKVCLSCLILLMIWLCVFIMCSIYICWKNKYELFDVGNGHHVYVQYGDVFSPSEADGKERNVIITVNRCFDTIVDDDLIARSTLHGIVVDRLADNNIYTPKELNNKIQKALLARGSQYENVDKLQKRKGNLKRYEPGEVVEIPGESGVTYFFLALTEFDEVLHANVNAEEYALAVTRMLQYINARSQGKPLVLPLIGGGAAGTGYGEREILEYLIKVIKMNRKIINCDVHIVVRESAKGSVAITNL